MSRATRRTQEPGNGLSTALDRTGSQRPSSLSRPPPGEHDAAVQSIPRIVDQNKSMPVCPSLSSPTRNPSKDSHNNNKRIELLCCELKQLGLRDQKQILKCPRCEHALQS